MLFSATMGYSCMYHFSVPERRFIPTLLLESSKCGTRCIPAMWMVRSPLDVCDFRRVCILSVVITVGFVQFFFFFSHLCQVRRTTLKFSGQNMTVLELYAVRSVWHHYWCLCRPISWQTLGGPVTVCRVKTSLGLNVNTHTINLLFDAARVSLNCRQLSAHYQRHMYAHSIHRQVACPMP